MKSNYTEDTFYSFTQRILDDIENNKHINLSDVFTAVNGLILRYEQAEFYENDKELNDAATILLKFMPIITSALEQTIEEKKLVTEK